MSPRLVSLWRFWAYTQALMYRATLSGQHGIAGVLLAGLHRIERDISRCEQIEAN